MQKNSHKGITQNMQNQTQDPQAKPTTGKTHTTSIDNALQGLIDFLQRHKPWSGFTPIAKSKDTNEIIIFTNNQDTHAQVLAFFQGNLQFDSFPIQITPLGFTPNTTAPPCTTTPNTTAPPCTNSCIKNKPALSTKQNTPQPNTQEISPQKEQEGLETRQPPDISNPSNNHTNKPTAKPFPTNLLDSNPNDKLFPWSTLSTLPYRRELPTSILKNATQQIQAIDSYRRERGFSTRSVSYSLAENFTNPATNSDRQLYSRLNEANTFNRLHDHAIFVEQLCHVLNVNPPPCHFANNEIREHTHLSIRILCEHVQARLKETPRNPYTNHATSQLLNSNQITLHILEKLKEPVRFPKWANYINHAITFKQAYDRAIKCKPHEITSLEPNKPSLVEPSLEPNKPSLEPTWDHNNTKGMEVPPVSIYQATSIPHTSLPFNDDTGFDIPTEQCQTITIQQLTQLPKDLKVNPIYLFQNFSQFWHDIQTSANQSELTINLIWKEAQKFHSKKHGGSLSCSTAYSLLNSKDEDYLRAHLPTHWAQVYALSMALKPNATLSLKYPWLLQIQSMHHIQQLTLHFLKHHFKSISSRAAFLSAQHNCTQAHATYMLTNGHNIRTDLWLPIVHATFQYSKSYILNRSEQPTTKVTTTPQPNVIATTPQSNSTHPTHPFISAQSHVESTITLMPPGETLSIPGHQHNATKIITNINIFKDPYNQFILEQHPDADLLQIFGPLIQNDHSITISSFVNSTSIDFLQKSIPTTSTQNLQNPSQSLPIMVDIEDLFTNIGVEQSFLDSFSSFSWVERLVNYTLDGRVLFLINIQQLSNIIQEASNSLKSEYMALVLLQLQSIQTTIKQSITHAILNHGQLHKLNHEPTQNNHEPTQDKPNHSTTPDATHTEQPTPTIAAQAEIQVKGILKQKEQIKLQLHPIAQLPNPYRRNALVILMRTIHSTKPFRAPGANSQHERQGWIKLYQTLEATYNLDPYDLIPEGSDLKPLDIIVETSERTMKAINVIIDLWGTLIAKGKQAV